MSYLMYIASDWPLEEVENAHYRTRLLSANEAEAAGIRLPGWLHSMDRDKPAILWQEKDPLAEWQREENGESGFDDDYSILKLSDDIWEIETGKKYRAEISWGRYSEGRARNIIAYIRKHLERAGEIEIWSLWLGEGGGLPQVHREKLLMDMLTPEKLKWLAEAPCFGENGTEYRIEGLPADILREMEKERGCESTQYCLIVRGTAEKQEK